MPTLEEIMSREVLTTGADASIAEAARAMLKAQVGSAVVMDGAYLVGIFTERDVVRAAASGSDPSSTPVSEWMTPDPVTATPDTEAEEGAEIMMSQGFRHLPVVRENDLVGIASLRDILRTRIRRPTS